MPTTPHVPVRLFLLRRRFFNIRTREQPNKYIILPPQRMASGGGGGGLAALHLFKRCHRIFLVFPVRGPPPLKSLHARCTKPPKNSFLCTSISICPETLVLLNRTTHVLHWRRNIILPCRDVCGPRCIPHGDLKPSNLDVWFRA